MVKLIHCLVLVFLLAPFQVSAAEDLRRREVDVVPEGWGATERLDYIMNILQREQKPATYWTYGWQAGFGGVMLGQAIWSASTIGSNNPDDIATRRERGIGAGAAGIGFIAHFLAWLPGRHGTEEIEALPDDAELRLRRAEEILEHGYKQERFVRGFLSHLGGLLVSGGSALILWQVWDLDKKAAINFPIAFSVGQARIWSQPVLSLRGWQSYREQYGGSSEMSLQVVPQPRGLSLALRF